MAKKKKSSRAIKLKGLSGKKSSGLLKILEVVVIFGAFAAFLMKFLRGKKK